MTLVSRWPGWTQSTLQIKIIIIIDHRIIMFLKNSDVSTIQNDNTTAPPREGSITAIFRVHLSLNQLRVEHYKFFYFAPEASLEN